MDEPIVLLDNPPVVVEKPPKNEKPISIRPERMKEEDESYEEYCARRTLVNKIIKQHLKHGVLFWDSKKQGTYKKKRQGV